MEPVDVVLLIVLEGDVTGCDMARATFRRDSGTSRAHSRRRTSVTLAGVLMCRSGTAPGIKIMFGPLPQPPEMSQHFIQIPASPVNLDIFVLCISRSNGQRTLEEGEKR